MKEVKRIPYAVFQSVKRVAQACDPLIVKKNKLEEKKKEIDMQLEMLVDQISSLEAGIVKMTGFHVYDLVEKTIEQGVDANGQPKKTTKYVTKDIVTYDSSTKHYIISTPQEETVEETPKDVVEEKEEAEEKENINPIDLNIFD